MDTNWDTVDRLIHDLGAIRAFVDEAEGLPEATSTPQVAEVRSAMNDATDAITRLFTDAQDTAVDAAWTAIARAQDAVLKARSVIKQARDGYERAATMRELNVEQFGRARLQSKVASDRAHRVGFERRAAFRQPVPPPRGPHRPKA